MSDSQRPRLRCHAVRVVGLLESVSEARPVAVLALADGQRLEVRVREHQVEHLHALVRRDVVVSGLAFFAESGRLVLIDADGLSLARVEDALFRHAPTARVPARTIDTVSPERARGVASFFGSWPGDESDDELLEALARCD